jgi:thiamine biosynthesis lipoprotein
VTDARKPTPSAGIALFVATLVAAFCTGEASAATSHAGAFVMGTVLDVTVVADDPALARRIAARAIDVAKHWDDVLTIWRPDGELFRLNAEAGRGAIEVSEDLRFALMLMLRLSEETHGAFDPAVGALVRHYASSSEDRQQPLISPLGRALTVQGSAVRLEAGIVIDPGGIGKGIAVDAIARELRIAGVSGAYVDFGGSSQFALGRDESGRPWRVAIAGISSGEILGSVELDGSLSTSQSRLSGDVSGPIVDPRTGAVVTAPRMATCAADSGAEADAWSTALVVTGHEGLNRIEAEGVAGLVRTPEGIYVTPTFERRMRRSNLDGDVARPGTSR